ncbi:unnamed protein product [Clonostachys solani]|uniref:Short-chain dehydrogenase n=1 Tax=Clonostachys solani TaxID=160281 RepID=A0A9N9Z9R3_9HYPO|nr:unnamed protein product [Clonostachys solani]
MASVRSIILTGANGSSGIVASEYLLKTYPQYHAILTVRSASDDDSNTRALRAVVSKYSSAKATIHQLDLSSLTDVKEFTDKINTDIQTGAIPPLKAIICNAYYWNLVSEAVLTSDGYEMTIQVSYISHVALVLRLLASFGSDGRIELLSSVVHYRRKLALMSPYIPEVPEAVNMDNVIHPPPDPDYQGRGFYRYASAKLFTTAWAFALNRHLEKDPKLKHITAVAMNPGNMWDARSFEGNTPSSIQAMRKYLFKPFQPVIRRVLDPTFRKTSEAGIDIIELALNPKFDGERGYYTMLKKDEPDPAVVDVAVQDRVWAKSLDWSGVTKEQTVLDINPRIRD